MAKVRCRAKQPLNCRMHRPQIEQATITNTLETLGVTWQQVKDFYLCTSRAKFSALATDHRGNQRNMTLRTCELCGQQHPYAPDYTDTPEFWNPKRQYHTIRQYVRHMGDLDPAIELPTDFDALIMFDGAVAFFIEANMTRAELSAWYVCKRKITHEDVADAEAHLTRVNQHGNMQVYQCTFGDHYHVGHTPKGKATLPAATKMSRKFNYYRARGKV